MKERIPAVIFPPGEFLKEELEARGWTQEDLADILDRPQRTINEIITGKRGITPETAKGLGDAFGTGAQFWMNLESAYRLSLTRGMEGTVSRRAVIYGKAPIRTMIKRKWIENSDSIEILEKNVAKFFNIVSINEEIQFRCAARKSSTYNTLTPLQKAWLFRAKNLAGGVFSKHFTQTRFNKGLEKLKHVISEPDDVKQVPQILSDSGIKLLIIEPLPQSKMDGACFWLDDNTPVVALSLRYNRIDWFWYTLMHELGHIKNGDGKDNNNCPVDDESRINEIKPEYELEADNFATEFLIPQEKLNEFIKSTHPMYSKNKIFAFANEIGVHPGIVVGQLQHRKEINYSQNREMLVKVREQICAEALTDGWGTSMISNMS
jgi:HTH-type transcriptional regulator/antitoxin HigA